MNHSIQGFGCRVFAIFFHNSEPTRAVLGAGQAVVQMVVRKGTRSEYAIKFFLSTAAFKEEASLYDQDSATAGGSFSRFLPKVTPIDHHYKYFYLLFLLTDEFESSVAFYSMSAMLLRLGGDFYGT